MFLMPVNTKSPELPASGQERGELLHAVKRLAKERYLQLEIGTNAEFEDMWRKAFFADGLDGSTGKGARKTVLRQSRKPVS